MPALATVAREKLQALEQAGRQRVLKVTEPKQEMLVVRGGKSLISFSSNDYLGLSRHAEVTAAANAATFAYGTGAGASRLVTGNHPLYAQLETKLAEWKGKEAALVLGSGYLANSGVIPALVGKGDLILADKLVHACLMDGAKLSGAALLRFRHNDLADCERLLSLHRAAYRHCLLVTDEIFSMDGDRAPLEDLQKIAAGNGAWLMADGAHSFASGPVPADIYTGTLSKALGSYGGYIAGERAVIDYLATSMRSFLFSTALPPGTVAAAIAALDLIQGNPARLQLPLAKARLFTQAAGLLSAQSAIVPVLLGSESRAMAASKILEAEGFLAVAIRPPTVPEGTSRLRLAFSALHKDADILHLAGIFKQEGWV